MGYRKEIKNEKKIRKRSRVVRYNEMKELKVGERYSFRMVI